MREYFESLEDKNLNPYASKSKDSKGRQFPLSPSKTRTCFQRDRDRIIHSKAFRRLKHKTQVFIATESDHYRSRLTHSIEVAQISRHLARLLKLNEDLAEAIALAHDLGHTPFGHSGEKELNLLMRNHGGFEHNLQSRRIIDELETKYPNHEGLNLSLEVREGLIKHTTPWDNPQTDKLTGFVTLEAQVCNIGDEIAYNNHDLDDGLTAGMLSDSELTEAVTLWRDAKKEIQKEYTNLSPKQLKYQINSYLISTQIENVIETSSKNIIKNKINTIEDIQTIRKPIIAFDKEMFEKNKELRKYLFQHFYSHNEVYRMNKKGQYIINSLFNAFMADTKLLPEDYLQKIKSKQVKERVICDYIAGMTDTYALKEYGTIFPGKL